ncbi:MAG: sigma-70 family RNA polymerase sigma factor [Chloroflexi bacterium]|nr:sigma-70 family RNA polymerase sigma factor [Chloroflexota bacterium]
MQKQSHTAVAYQRLNQYIANETDALLSTLRLYVLRSGLASGTAVADTALDLLNDVTAEALQHADRFQPDRQPKAWLLGIAANLIRQRQTAQAKRDGREPLIQDLLARQALVLSIDLQPYILNQPVESGPSKAVGVRSKRYAMRLIPL